MKSAIAPSDKFLTHLANDFPVSSEMAPCKDPVAAIKSATNTEVLGPSSFHNDGAALLNLSPSIQSSCIKAPQCTNSRAIPHSKARCVSPPNASETNLHSTGRSFFPPLSPFSSRAPISAGSFDISRFK